MTFPTLPPNSSLKIPPAPTKGKYAGMASDIHRLAGLVLPVHVAHRCSLESMLILNGRDSRSAEAIEALIWLYAHGRQWVELMQAETVAASMKAAA